MTGRAIVLRGDAAILPLPGASVDLIVTSPPYFGLRSYTDGGQHYAGQIGSEATPAEYIAALIGCTREWVRVLKPEGSLFVNLGDKYNSAASGQNGLGPSSSLGASKGPGNRAASERRFQQLDQGRGVAVNSHQPKSLLGLPWRYALACTDQLALILRAEIIWDKPNGLPESVTDRVRRSHEQVFHFTRQPRYYSAVDEIREAGTGRGAATWEQRKAAGEPMRQGEQRRTFGDGLAPNPLGKLPGSVWAIPSAPLTVPPHLGVDHFAAYPPELVRRIILGWSPPGICTACGQGRRPVVDAERIKSPKHSDGSIMGSRRSTGDIRGWDGLPRFNMERAITGYACACPRPDAPARPGIVLDPFSGTGTTMLVAAAYGRTGIGIDRSADYCRLAAWRVRDPAERARAMQVPKPPPVPDGQGSLFDEVAL